MEHITIGGIITQVSVCSREFVLPTKTRDNPNSYANRCAVHADKSLSDCTFIILDIEATGGNPQRNALLEIAALKVVDGEVQDRYTSLVNPRMAIPDIVKGITGINANTVKNAPPVEKVMPEFLAFIGDYVLVSHNAQGDVKFLRHTALKTCRKQIKNFYLCTHLLLAQLFPNAKDRSLKGAARDFKLPTLRGHRAEADAEMTLSLFSLLLVKLQKLGITTVADAMRCQGDIESGKKVGWALDSSVLKSLPACP
ncbi:MAG: 3'-5' exonuclease, partial [Pseudomonadota bacterium]|nr:3'-5' exonuclease [Pseudomonadota bacterium]